MSDRLTVKVVASFDAGDPGEVARRLRVLASSYRTAAEMIERLSFNLPDEVGGFVTSQGSIHVTISRDGLSADMAQTVQDP